MIRYRARWLYPGNGAPTENSLVTIDQGRIVEILPDDGGEANDLGAVALIPGLINAHTHLEFSSLSHPLEPRTSFPDWIRSVICWRRQVTGAEHRSAIIQGLHESRRGGVTAIGEIATSDWPLEWSCSEITGSEDVSPAEHPDGIVFRELLGLSDEAVSTQVNVARRFLREFPTGGRFHPGLSPHAPYSVHPDLFEELCQLAEQEHVPLAFHLAESPAELELLDRGTGSLVSLFQELGVWRPGVIPSGTPPRHYLERLASLSRALIVHGNLLSAEEIAFVAAHPQLSVAYCPRTHAAMQSGIHPWRTMRESGINVVLGTDGRASNPDLSLWKELQFLHAQAPDIPASDLLRMATVDAAAALGLEQGGRLTPGGPADLAMVQLSPRAQRDPESFLLEPDCRILGTLVS